MSQGPLRRFAVALERSWYTGRAWCWLKPLAWIYGAVVALRRSAYSAGWLQSQRIGVPVLVVGNITVGGSGKTPLILALIEKLQARGHRVGVVSRGYGGTAPQYPLSVTAQTPTDEAGDEPVLIARRSRAAVAVDPVRPRAAAWLVEQAGVDCVLADDGLQHYALARDAEIAVTDACRGLGNRWLLPAGPLRERVARLDSVDLALMHGEGHDFWLEPGAGVSINDGRTRALHEFTATPVHAVAGIGDPQRFFAMLRALGLELIEHAMPDHHAYRGDDISFGDDWPVLMTEKDAVKCQRLARDLPDSRHWSVPVRLVFSAACEQRIDSLLNRLCSPSDMQSEQ